MSEREYLLSKGLPRALKDLRDKVATEQVWPPQTSLYAHNRIVANDAGRANAARMMDPDDALSMGQHSRDASRAGVNGYRPAPRLQDVHAANAAAYRAKRMERMQVVEGKKVVAAAEKILRRRLP